jgi:Spy/CpxP family protein refolding chaperone
MTMTKMMTKLSLVACTAALLSAGTATAQPYGDGTGPGKGFRRGVRGKRTEMLKAKLGLTDAQVQQIKAIRVSQRAQCKPYREQIRSLRQQMRALLQADVINEAQIVALHAKIRSIQQVLGEQRLQSRLQVMRVLTKEQRVKMAQSKRGFGKRGFGKRGPGKRGFGKRGFGRF